MNYGKKGVYRKDKQLASTGTLIRKKFTVVFFKALLVCFFAVIVIGACASFGILKGVIDSAPSIDEIDPSPTGFLSKVLDTAGNETATLVASGSNRVYVTIDEIPLHTQHAFVAIEDERFYEHNGIDMKGILRAGVTGIASGNFSEGASTITQQLLKNNVFTDWVSQTTLAEKVERKIQEQYLAIELSKAKSKAWVLENYLNTINLGQNTLGVQSASLRYFGKDVSDLTISESAVIAAISQNPSRWNPVKHPENNKQRQKTVLDYMKEQNYISQKEYDEALADDVYSRIQQVNIEFAQSNPNSYFVDAVINNVVQDLVELKGYTDTQAIKALYQGGLTIESTQHPGIQTICDEEINNLANYPDNMQYSFSYRLTIEKNDGEIKNYSDQTMMSYYLRGDAMRGPDPDYSLNFNSEEEAWAAIEAYKAAIMEPEDKIIENGESITYTLQPQSAVTIIDQSTGEVKAIVGGRGDKTASRTLNRATDTQRQPGSTFKILAAYAPALDSAGMTLATVQDDAPYAYSNGTPLQNYDNTYRGFTTLRQAITKSINVVTVKTLTDISPQVGYDYLLNFGFSTLVQDDIVEALALGGITKGVTNLELTAAFASIANKGTYIKPRFYTRILDHDGNILIDNTIQKRTVLKETTAFLLTSAMQDVVTAGTGTAVSFADMPIAGKTGTTTKNKDALFVGYTPYYTCTVWGGYDDNTPQYTTAYPKAIWRSIMSRLHEALDYRDFEQVDGIVNATICIKSGKLAIGGVCDSDPRGSMVRSELFANGTVPTEYCDHHTSATICAASGELANEFCPEELREHHVYIVGGSFDSEDGSYLINTHGLCPLHTAESIIESLPPIPDVPIPEIPVPDDNNNNNNNNSNGNNNNNSNPDDNNDDELPADENNNR
ncbi:PBP1A family penicillin-binding protein [Lachnospiraceae bacterium ZAX-1]